MKDAEIIIAIRKEHQRANIGQFEDNPKAVIHWDRARVDPGGTVFGAGPYLKVPVTCRAWGDEDTVWRVYPTARVLRRLQRAAGPADAPERP